MIHTTDDADYYKTREVFGLKGRNSLLTESEALQRMQGCLQIRRSRIYRLLVDCFMMDGTIPIGVFCCVMLIMITHISALSDKCPVIKTEKGPPVFTEKSSPDDEMDYDREQTYKLRCCVRGHPKPNITWSRDNEPLPLSVRFVLQNDNQELIIYRVRPEDSGEYMCVAQNIHGVSNHSIYLDIRELKPEINSPKVKIENPEKVVVGSNITLQCQVTSDYKPIMSWFKMNGTMPRILASDFVIDSELRDQYISTVTITNVSFDDAGIYKCQAKNAVGYIVEKNINLTVVEREEAPTRNTNEIFPEETFAQKYLTAAVGGGLALLAVVLTVMTSVYIKKHKPEGWVTWKLIQMGVVNPPKCHAESHGEDGDDECICVVTWDVFISYNNKDRAWVLNVLHKELTNAYNVCIDYQNFIPGGGVVDNIARCIWRSNTTLFVVSRDFLRSGWSKMEFEITQDKIRRAQGSLVVIMLEDIKWQELPPILRRYTTGKMRVDCKDRQLQPKAWRRLRSLLGPSIDPKENVDAKETPMTVPCEGACLLMMESSV